MQKYLILIFFLGQVASQLFAQDSPVKVYPNPFVDEMNITIAAECGDSLSLEIFDLTGRSQIKFQDKGIWHADTLSFEIDLQTGMYVILTKISKESYAEKVACVSNNGEAKFNLILSGEKLNCTEYPFAVFPNPATNHFFVRQPATALPYSIEVLSTTGKLVYRKDLQNHAVDHKVMLPHYGAGIYFVRITSERGTEIEKVTLLH